MTGKPMGGGEKPIWCPYLNCNIKNTIEHAPELNIVYS